MKKEFLDSGFVKTCDELVNRKRKKTTDRSNNEQQLLWHQLKIILQNLNSAKEISEKEKLDPVRPAFAMQMGPKGKHKLNLEVP